MIARPITLAIAAVLMVVIGSGVAVVGAVLLAVAAGAVGSLPVGGASGIAALLGVVAVVGAAVTVSAAIGLWLRRPWGWAASLAIAVMAVIGAVIALETSGSQLPIQAGLVLTVAATALLLAPSTRSASGVG